VTRKTRHAVDRVDGEAETIELVPNKTDPSCEGTHHCLVTSDLLAAAIHENSHGVAGFQGRMEKLRDAVDADPETAATPLDSKFQGSPTCRQFWVEGDPVALR
jgi:hypothetical protein